MPEAQLGHHQTRFRFTQEANDLLFCKSLLRIQSPVSWDWTPSSTATQLRADVGIVLAAVLPRLEKHSGVALPWTWSRVLKFS